MIVASPALELPPKRVEPACAPLTALPLLVNVPLPAVDVSVNSVSPPPEPKKPLFVPELLIKLPLPAVEAPPKSVKPPPDSLTALPLLIKVPWLAVEVPVKVVKPPFTRPLTAPLLVKVVELPALAPLSKSISPCLPAPLTAVTKFCVRPALFAMPVPLRVRVRLGLALMV